MTTEPPHPQPLAWILGNSVDNDLETVLTRDMSTSTKHLTRTEARRYAKSLSDWGFSGIEVIESFDTQEFRVVAENRCGNRRVVRTPSDFAELRDMEGGR